MIFQRQKIYGENKRVSDKKQVLTVLRPYPFAQYTFKDQKKINDENQGYHTPARVLFSRQVKCAIEAGMASMRSRVHVKFYSRLSCTVIDADKEVGMLLLNSYC